MVQGEEVLPALPVGAVAAELFSALPAGAVAAEVVLALPLLTIASEVPALPFVAVAARSNFICSGIGVDMARCRGLLRRGMWN